MSNRIEIFEKKTQDTWVWLMGHAWLATVRCEAYQKKHFNGKPLNEEVRAKSVREKEI